MKGDLIETLKINDRDSDYGKHFSKYFSNRKFVCLGLMAYQPLKFI